MATVLLGNIILFLDPSLQQHQRRPVSLESFFFPPKHASREFSNIELPPSVSAARMVNFEGEMKVWGKRTTNKMKKKVGIGFDGEEESEEEDGFGGDWEKEMRVRMKEVEEMRELEKRAEELVSGSGGGGDDEEDGGCGTEEETEEEKRMRVRKELEKVAKEQAERRETAKLMFDLGQKAYGRGMYGKATEFLEGALTIIPKPTLFGGEIQIWLAMAYEANNRHADCIDLYRQLEMHHPSSGIRRQASELRYILQAPKLKISQDEMVTIPLIGSSYDSYAGTWTDKYKDREQNFREMTTTNQLPSSRDYGAGFMVWRPPVGWEKNRAFWVSVILWLGLVGVALTLPK